MEQPSVENIAGSGGAGISARGVTGSSTLFTRARLLVETNPGKFAFVFFIGGFLWDYLTLTRADALLDNALLLLYVAIVSVFGFFAMLRRAGRALPTILKKFEHWLPHAMQFAFGALFSANVIFYWQSTTRTAGAVYFVLLLSLLVANEFVAHDRSPILYFGLLFVASHSFFMLLIPVAIGKIGFVPFLFSGLSAAGLCWVMWRMLVVRNALPSKTGRYGSVAVVLALFALSDVFYLNKWIPPVPLAVREMGVYHSVERDGTRFALSFEPSNALFGRNRPSKVFHRDEGEAVYCFASVFAPHSFENEIFHSWYRFDPNLDVWEKRDRIGYKVEGGRTSGYRGYSFKRNVEGGSWRVDVETDGGVVIGRTYFDIVDRGDEARALRLRFK